MNEIEKAERVLKMLMLLAGNRKYSVDELSSRFSLSGRSVQRYIQLFRNVGFVIPRPTDGLYSIEKNSPKFREMSELLHFSQEEAYILSRAIHSIDDVNVLKTNLIKKLYALYDFDRVAVTVVKRENSENVHNLIQAIKTEKQVLLRHYESANSSKIGDRLVEPFDFTTNYISVWAYEPESGENKTFKTARIGKVEICPKSWDYGHLHQKQPVDVFRISGPPAGNVTLGLSLRAKNLLVEEYPLAEKYLSELPGNRFRFEAEVNGWEGVGRFVLGLCNEIEVMGPDGLKGYIHEKIKCFSSLK